MRFIFLLSALIVLFPRFALADCLAPSSLAGIFIFNQDFCVMQYCNGTDWIGLGTPNPAACSAPPPSGDFTTGLIGHWKLDETSGSVIADSAGANTGTWIDNVNNDVAEETVAGKIGTALSFDGVDDSVKIVKDATLDNLGLVTYAAWVYPTSFPFDCAGTNSGPGNGNGWAFTIGNSGQLSFGVDTTAFGSQNFGTSSTDTLILNTWQHVAVTWTGVTNDETTAKLYINGSEVSGYVAPNGSSGTWDDVPEDLYIGLHPEGSYANGWIDDFRIYDRPLTAADVAALYASYP